MMVELNYIIAKVKAKLAIENSESKKIYNLIKEIPKGDKRNEALQKEIDGRSLNKEDIKELMYDLTHTLKMINIKIPSIKKTKINYEEIADVISDEMSEHWDVFEIELSGGAFTQGSEDVSIDVNEISVGFDELYKKVRNKNNEEYLPEKLSEKDKKEISEKIDGELLDVEVDDVDLDMFISEPDNAAAAIADIIIDGIDIKNGKLHKNFHIYFSKPSKIDAKITKMKELLR